MTVEDAVHPAPDGAFLDVEVTPGAKRDAFPHGYDPWRRRVGVRVREPPADGRANDAVRTLVARFLGLAPDRVRIASGATSRRKRLRLVGAEVADVQQRLRGAVFSPPP